MYPEQASDAMLTSVVFIECYGHGEFISDEFPSYVMLVLPTCTVYVENEVSMVV